MSRLRDSRVCALVLVMLAAGCTVGPNYHPPKPSVPAAWTGPPQDAQRPAVTSNSGDLARWWEQMHDPILTSLIEEALKANLSAASAEARALRGVAVAGLLPSVTATGSYQRQSGPLYVQGGGSRNLFQVGLDAVWEMDIFGGVRRNVESATANVQAAVEDIRNIHVSIATEVGLDYIQLSGFQQEAAIARDNLNVQQHSLELIRKLYGAGFDSGLDMAGAETAVAAEAQIPVYETGARQSIYALSVLLARNPGDLVERLTPIGELPPIPEQIPAGLPSDLLRRRPDIRQAEAQLHSATAQIGVAVAQLFPQFSLTGCVNWQNTPGHALFMGPVASWPVSRAARSLPIFMRRRPFAMRLFSPTGRQC
jgi:outer membrane protein, multidrug efflux system